MSKSKAQSKSKCLSAEKCLLFDFPLKARATKRVIPIVFVTPFTPLILGGAFRKIGQNPNDKRNADAEMTRLLPREKNPGEYQTELFGPPLTTSGTQPAYRDLPSQSS
jgi:hypothetical protein